MNEQTMNIVILTKSSKYKNYCVAGIETRTNKWVRLISNSRESHGALSYEDIKYLDGTIVSILDIVQIKVLDFQPTAIQPENVLINNHFYLEKKGTMQLQDVFEIHPPQTQGTILGNESHFIIPSMINKVNQSLVLIKVSNAEIYRYKNMGGNEKVKIRFIYNGKKYSNISVTDPDYYSVQNSQIIKNAALVISLPDDEWSSENGYYKFAAKIFPL